MAAIPPSTTVPNSVDVWQTVSHLLLFRIALRLTTSRLMLIGDNNWTVKSISLVTLKDRLYLSVNRETGNENYILAVCTIAMEAKRFVCDRKISSIGTSAAIYRAPACTMRESDYVIPILYKISPIKHRLTSKFALKFCLNQWKNDLGRYVFGKNSAETKWKPSHIKSI